MGEGKKEKTTKNGTVPRDDPLPVPPDGGWGWMVVFASFMIHIIADGIVYSFGIFYMEFLDYYKGGKGETAWVGSLVPGVTLSVGPLASVLTNKYGCRVTTIMGAIIAAIGFILSLFAPNLYFLYFSFGILSGLGFGLIYLPAIVSVGYYFEKKRAFATGLAVCGSGLGAFIFNPLSKFLIDTYGWQGAILIEAGIILNCIICGAMFRPLLPPVTSSIKKKPSENGKTSSVEMQALLNGDGDKVTSTQNSNHNIPSLVTSNGKPATGLPPPSSMFSSDGALDRLQRRNSEKGVTSVTVNRQGDFHFSDLFDIEIEVVCEPEVTPPTPTVNGDSNPPKPTADNELQTCETKLLTPRDAGETFMSDGALHMINRRKPNGSTASTPRHNPNIRRLLSHEVTPGSVYLSGSLLNVSMHRSHPALYLTSMTSIPASPEEVDSVVCGCIPISGQVKATLKQYCDFSLLKDSVFLMFVISNFFTSIGFNMPFIYLPDRAVDEGFTEDQAKWLVSIVGISNTVGRVVFGFTSDRPGVNRLMLYNTALTICGVATALSPLCNTYPLLIVYACVFGVFIGVYVSLTSVVLVDLLGLEMLTNSFGLLLMFQGFATLIGPPIAGWLYDGTGSYDVSFEVAGVVVAISGIMLYFIPCVRKCAKSNHDKTIDVPA